MPEPLAITTGVLSILGVCYNLGIELKKFQDGVKAIDPTVNGLINEVDGLQIVLKTLGDTFEYIESQQPMESTGHIGTLWKNVSRSLEDCNATLTSLFELLENINKSSKVLDSSRKHVRLKLAADQITLYQGQIQSYRGALQLSLQAIILWKQVSSHMASESILPTLEQLHELVRDMARDLNTKIQLLADATAVQEKQTTDDRQLLHISNLRECVRSAATVVSSASTILIVEGADQFSTCDSNFHDLLEPEVNETMQRWISSNTVYEYNEAVEMGPISKDTSQSTNTFNSISDSDSDLEAELTKALLQTARIKIVAGDTSGATRYLRLYLSKLPKGYQQTQNDKAKRLAVLEELFALYIDSGSAANDTNAAKSTLLQIISLREQNPGDQNALISRDYSNMSELLLSQREFVEAELYGRRALKNYRKSGFAGNEQVRETLDLLVRISVAGGRSDEADTYSALLAVHDHQERGSQEPSDAAVSELLGHGIQASDESVPDQQSPQHESQDAVQEKPLLTPDVPAMRDLSLGETSDATPQATPGPSQRIRSMLDVGDPAATTMNPHYSIPEIDSEVQPALDADPPASVSGVMSDSKELMINSGGSIIRTASSLDFEARVLSGSSSEAVESRALSDESLEEIGTTIEAATDSLQTGNEVSAKELKKLKYTGVVMGEGCTGKTFMLQRMKNAKVELFYHVTTSCNAYLFQLDSTPHLSSQLSLWDTPGHPDYKHNRILFLSTWPVLKPDVILLVISIDDPDFLSELEDDWMPEIRRALNYQPIILLIGTKKEIRDDPLKVAEVIRDYRKSPITIEQGQEWARKIGAVHYLECSAYTCEGLSEILPAVQRAILVKEAADSGETEGLKSRKKKRSKAFRSFFRRTPQAEGSGVA